MIGQEGIEFVGLLFCPSSGERGEVTLFLLPGFGLLSSPKARCNNRRTVALRLAPVLFASVSIAVAKSGGRLRNVMALIMMDSVRDA